MNKRYSPPTWALTGGALRQANERTALKLDKICEQESFKAFQRIGYHWEPTREMLTTHIATDTNRQARNEDHIRWLAWVCAAEAIAIVALAILLRLR